MKAINNNGHIEYPSNFMLIGDNWVSNPNDEQLQAIGYKDLVYIEVDEVNEQFTETETEIIIYYLKWIEPEPIVEDDIIEDVVVENENNEEFINV